MTVELVTLYFVSILNIIFLYVGRGRESCKSLGEKGDFCTLQP